MNEFQRPHRCPRCLKEVSVPADCCPACGQRLPQVHAELRPLDDSPPVSASVDTTGLKPQSTTTEEQRRQSSAPVDSREMPQTKPSPAAGLDTGSRTTTGWDRTRADAADSRPTESSAGQKRQPESARRLSQHRPDLPSRTRGRRQWAGTAIVCGLVIGVAAIWILQQSSDAIEPELTIDATGQAHTLEFTSRQLSEQDRQQLRDSPSLRKLMADRSTLSDADLEAVGAMSGLRWLYLKSTRVTDTGLSAIQNMKHLDRLHLYGTKVTDAGLTHLAGATKLTVLGLSRTAVTDAGLIHLKGMPHLEILGLACTSVTDNGLNQLSHMKKLKLLDVRSTQVTEAGLTRFRKAHPGCVIKR